MFLGSMKPEDGIGVAVLGVDFTRQAIKQKQKQYRQPKPVSIT